MPEAGGPASPRLAIFVCPSDARAAAALPDSLDATTRATLLAAIDAGTATLVTKSTATGAYTALPVCPDGTLTALPGCVLVQALDENGLPTEDVPVVVRFTGIVGHFSTWAVAIVEAIDDTTPPEIAPHDDVVAEATGPTGAVVPYTLPPATDDVDGPVAVVCQPASGSLFPLGSTEVQCTAEDTAGNGAAPASFTVTVLPVPDDDLASLLAAVGASALPRGLRRHLAHPLEQALKDLDRRKGPHLKQACQHLEQFVKRVLEESTGKKPKIDTATAAAWIGTAQRIQMGLGC